MLNKNIKKNMYKQAQQWADDAIAESENCCPLAMSQVAWDIPEILLRYAWDMPEF